MIFGTPFETPFDMPPATTQYKTYSLDAIMANVLTVPYKADALLQARCTKTYSIDAIMESVRRVLYESDLLLAGNGTQIYQMSGRIKSDIHEFFYVMDAALMRCNVRASYRMGGLISNQRFTTARPVGSFVAAQSLIEPDDINADDRFGLAR